MNTSTVGSLSLPSAQGGLGRSVECSAKPQLASLRMSPVAIQRLVCIALVRQGMLVRSLRCVYCSETLNLPGGQHQTCSGSQGWRPLILHDAFKSEYETLE